MMIQTKLNKLFGFVAAALLSSGLANAGILPKTVLTPADNPITAEKVELGKQLFFDPRLSIDGTLSCNSCHNITSSGTDKHADISGRRGDRSPPTIWNAAFLTALFWDGRAATLEEQAKEPPLNPLQMGMPNEAAVVERLNAIPGYVEQFKAAFGDNDAVSYDNMAKAIAAFERTLITPNSPHDRFLAGDKTAMSEQALRGKQLFEQSGCNTCHGGTNFAGPSLPIGQGFYQKFPNYRSEYNKKYDLSSDKGRFEVTKARKDMNRWRVPSLRNVALTAPYFHNGSIETLDEAVRIMAKTQLNLKLSDKNVNDIVAFLTSLNGERPEISMPHLPKPVNNSLVSNMK